MSLTGQSQLVNQLSFIQIDVEWRKHTLRHMQNMNISVTVCIGYHQGMQCIMASQHYRNCSLFLINVVSCLTVLR